MLEKWLQDQIAESERLITHLNSVVGSAGPSLERARAAAFQEVLNMVRSMPERTIL